MILSYALISALILCCGYLCYRWVMADERQHSYNRAILYAIYGCSLLLPLFILPGGMSTQPPVQSAMIEIGNLTPLDVRSELAVNNDSQWISFSGLAKILVIIYLIGVGVMTLISLYGIVKLLGIIRKGEKIPAGKYAVVITGNTRLAPFSWMRYIVMTSSDYAEAGNVIMEHELCHLRMYHWIDLMFAQSVICLQWFNPAAWLMREELRTVHEYQADDAVIKSGADMSGYQKMLIKKAVGSRFQSFANSLNHSKLKKRITMMYKEKSSTARRLSALLLAPALAAGCFATAIPAVARVLDSFAEVSFATDSESKVTKNSEIEKITESEFMVIQEMKDVDQVLSDENPEKVKDQISAAEEMFAKEDSPVETESVTESNEPSEAVVSVDESEKASNGDKEILLAPEQPAEYPDGMASLLKYLAGEIKYPEEAIKNNEEGMVLVKFVVEADGSVGDVEIMRSISPSLDAEAMRVVKGMNKWNPGRYKGKPVATWFHLPVKFKLPEEKSDK